MCRWLAYFGDPIRPEELLYQPGRSLIEQSRRGTPGAAVNNGDGYGMGWYGLHDRPGLFRSISPAWGDANLRELSAQIRSDRRGFENARLLASLAESRLRPSGCPRPSF